jgi:hypothetical protein
MEKRLKEFTSKIVSWRDSLHPSLFSLWHVITNYTLYVDLVFVERLFLLHSVDINFAHTESNNKHNNNILEQVVQQQAQQ